MKICPFCHTANEDTAQNCKNCNVNLQAAIPEKPKNNTILIVIIIMLFLTIITGMILAFLYLNNKNQAQPSNIVSSDDKNRIVPNVSPTGQNFSSILIPVSETETETETETVLQTQPPATTPRKAPEIKCNILVQANPPYDGFTYTLMVSSGNYDYYYIECKEYSGGSSSAYTSLSERHSEKSLYLTAGSSLDHVTATVTPYYSDGTSGKVITCTARQPSYLGQGTPVTGTGKMILRTVPDDSGDSSGSTTITKIPDGSEIEIFSTDSSSWRYVIYGNYAGYAKTEYAKLYSEISNSSRSSNSTSNVSMPSNAYYLGEGTPSTGTGKVILRSSMDDSSDSNIITKIKDGSKVYVYDIGSSKWYYITYDGSYSGYAKIQYIKLGNSSSSSTSNVSMPSNAYYLGEGTPSTGTGKVILRSSMDDSSDSNIITKIKDGSAVTVYDVGSSKWYYITYSGYSGYAKIQYIKLY